MLCSKEFKVHKIKFILICLFTTAFLTFFKASLLRATCWIMIHRSTFIKVLLILMFLKLT